MKRKSNETFVSCNDARHYYCTFMAALLTIAES